MQTKILLLLMLCNAALQQSWSQGGLYISSGTGFYIKSGTTVSVDSLVLLPTADFAINGANAITRYTPAGLPFPAAVVARGYRFAAATAPFSGTVGLYYRDEELGAIPEEKLTPFIQNGDTWKQYANDAQRDAVINKVSVAVLSDVPLNALVLAQEAGLFVATFTLVNAGSETDIRRINDGDVLDLSQLPRALLNIRATTAPANSGSVVFQLSGQQKYNRLQNSRPFALFSDNKGNYLGGRFEPGTYTLVATPYALDNGKGVAGMPLTVRFSVVYPATIVQFRLVSAATGQMLRTIEQGDMVDLAKLPTNKLSISAATFPDTVGSVLLKLGGSQHHQQTENLNPYALFGDNGSTQYNPWNVAEGNYLLEGVPFSAPRGRGTSGTAARIGFTIINTNTAPSAAGLSRQQSFAPSLSKAPSLLITPNPVTTQSIIRFSVPATGNARLTAVNAAGAEVAQLFQGMATAGVEYQIPFNGTTLAGGVYTLQLFSGGRTLSVNAIVVR